MKRLAAPNARRLLKKLFAQFQKQVDELENRAGQEDPEREAKLLGALAGTLERLTALKTAQDEAMKKQDKKHAKGLERGDIIRALCARLEKLAQEDERSKKDRAASGGVKRRAG